MMPWGGAEKVTSVGRNALHILENHTKRRVSQARDSLQQVGCKLDIPEVTFPHKEGATFCSRHVFAFCSSQKWTKLHRNRPASPVSVGAGMVGTPALHTATVQRDTSKLNHEPITLRRKSTKSALHI